MAKSRLLDQEGPVLGDLVLGTGQAGLCPGPGPRTGQGRAPELGRMGGDLFVLRRSRISMRKLTLIVLGLAAVVAIATLTRDARPQASAGLETTGKRR